MNPNGLDLLIWLSVIALIATALRGAVVDARARRRTAALVAQMRRPVDTTCCRQQVEAGNAEWSPALGYRCKPGRGCRPVDRIVIDALTESADRGGVEQRPVRRAHNPEVAGSNPAPASKFMHIVR